MNTSDATNATAASPTRTQRPLPVGDAVITRTTPTHVAKYDRNPNSNLVRDDRLTVIWLPAYACTLLPQPPRGGCSHLWRPTVAHPCCPSCDGALYVAGSIHAARLPQRTYRHRHPHWSRPVSNSRGRA